MICAECDKEFASQRSLHAHLKAHKMSLADYYEKHFPRFDALTRKQIKFKNLDHYNEQFFVSSANLDPWLDQASSEEAKSMLDKMLRPKLSNKGLSYSISTLYLQSYGIYDRVDIEKFMPWGEFCLQHSLVNNFYDEMSPEAWEDDSPIEILVDTREQHDLTFDSVGFDITTRRQKLDFGDYTRGDKHDNTFVERKSLADFIGTITQNQDRFYEEIDRAEEMDAFVFVVVEASVEDIRNYNDNNRYKINLNRLWHEARELMLKYPNNLQLVFAQNRQGAERITARILQQGRSLWRVDVQHELDKRILNRLGKRTSKV